MHMQGECLERAPDLGGSHNWPEGKVGSFPAQQHVAVCKAGLKHSVARCAVQNMSLAGGHPLPASEIHMESNALCLLWAAEPPRGRGEGCYTEREPEPGLIFTRKAYVMA